MKYFLISYFSFLISNFSFAHPGIGIVKDSKGNIYYTDLKQVWKIDIKGEKTAVVNNVHTHELYMDADDNLYGEHLWYNGEKLDTWGHYVWCLKNDGTLIKEIEPTEGFLNNYSFVRDSAGNMYWVERFTNTRFMKKSLDGKITKLVEGKFGFIGWLHCTAAGVIYFIENSKLQKLTPDGKITLLAGDLESKTTEFSQFGRNYDGYGIWTDAADNIYIAMIAAKKINRISPDGRVQTIIYSHSLWTASSGLFDNDGNLWLLESSIAGETKARKINKDELNDTGASSKSFVQQTHFMITMIVGIIIAIAWLLLRWVLNKQTIKPRDQFV
jgi:hypothetical protein